MRKCDIQIGQVLRLSRSHAPLCHRGDLVKVLSTNTRSEDGVRVELENLGAGIVHLVNADDLEPVPEHSHPGQLAVKEAALAKEVEDAKKALEDAERVLARVRSERTCLSEHLAVQSNKLARVALSLTDRTTTSWSHEFAQTQIAFLRGKPIDGTEHDATTRARPLYERFIQAVKDGPGDWCV